MKISELTAPNYFCSSGSSIPVILSSGSSTASVFESFIGSSVEEILFSKSSAVSSFVKQLQQLEEGRCT